MTNEQKFKIEKRTSNVARYTIISVLAFVMIIPLIWLVFASVKPSNEVFDTTKLLPSKLKLENYINGWNSVKPYSYFRFYLNTFLLILPVIVGNVCSSCLVGYGFARGKIKGKNMLFLILIGTMMLPGTTTMIPSYILFNKLGWTNTYLPFIVSAFLGGSAFFTFMMVQFMRGIPKEMDDSAMIDGCNSFSIFTRIILPMCKPTIITIVIFTFLWTWDDFMGQLIYLSEVKKYTVALALKIMVDPLSVVNWGAILAMSLVSIIPSVIIYFVAQDYFVEGMSTSGLKT